MILLKTSAELQKYLTNKASSGIKTGFVPTMGALHQGHLSLISESKRLTTCTVCSIFVNPAQFNDPADFNKYPVTIENDIYLLEKAGCDVLFLPDVTEIYPNGTQPSRVFELGELERVFEGRYRPGHFQGVCQVMQRLLEIVQPAKLFMGQKDYQQCMVIGRLIALNHWTIDMQVVPIMREASGLAMSSRNTRLSDTGRQHATAIFEALTQARKTLPSANTSDVLQKALAHLLGAGFEKIDYLALADARTLAPLEYWQAGLPTVILVAAFIEGVRLIDNMVLAEAD